MLIIYSYTPNVITEIQIHAIMICSKEPKTRQYKVKISTEINERKSTFSNISEPASSSGRTCIGAQWLRSHCYQVLPLGNVKLC